MKVGRFSWASPYERISNSPKVHVHGRKPVWLPYNCVYVHPSTVAPEIIMLGKAEWYLYIMEWYTAKITCRVTSQTFRHGKHGKMLHKPVLHAHLPRVLGAFFNGISEEKMSTTLLCASHCKCLSRVSRLILACRSRSCRCWEQDQQVIIIASKWRVCDYTQPALQRDDSFYYANEVVGHGWPQRHLEKSNPVDTVPDTRLWRCWWSPPK